jgi:tetratricopeptide (TPR) repeat protein
MKLENDEQIEAAILIYEDILRKGQNTGVIYRLASAYKKVGRYDDGIRLLQNRLKRSPRDVTAHNRLADLFLAAGMGAKSDLQIERILEISPNQGAYTSVGQRYERLNQDERARDVYLKGRRELRDPELFSRELGQIYERAENYPAAVRAYGMLARQKPQFVSLVEAKLKTIARNARNLVPLYDHLLEEMKGAHRDSRMTRLFTTFAIEAGMTPAALKEMLTLPVDAAVEGNLLRIGREALGHGDPGDAILAFEALSTRTRNRNLRAQAEAGMARGLDLAGRFEEALQKYKSVLASRANDHVREETSYRLGHLFWRIDLSDSAIAILDGMIARGNRSKWRTSAIDLLGDIHLTIGNEDHAKRTYLLNAAENRGKEEAATALFKLSRLHTIRKEYASAQKALKRILGGGLASTAYNDAIELSYTLEIGQAEDVRGLNVYAKGLWQETKGNTAAAARIYLDMGHGGEGALTDRRLKRGIELLVDLGDFQQVEHWSRDLATRESSLKPWAHFLVGVSLEKQNRPNEAVTVYETLLVEFPDSLEADRARERLTSLREATYDKTRNAG